MAIARRLCEVHSKLPKFNEQCSSSIFPASCTTFRSTYQPEQYFRLLSKSYSEQKNILLTAIGVSKNNTQMQISRLERWTMSPFFQIQTPRFFSADSKNSDYSKEVDEINAKFAEAREEIEMAMESKETVYFDEEADSARAVVKETLEMFDALLARLPENQRGVVQRSMGLKMEQLKAEFEQLNE
ncbi:hypothetical protein SUGI_1066970 [Cryptomeria japonica]|uniref:embryogenesis-like protein n=1 Tax=Cryptomeria japonica TaxID=3369 RepID=UPI00241499B4|nr:embryogenesis-like protein [Cryptomeria japonica]GLJ50144.1 hypothetical protein SUGI_1066970 [Cryptomeria japonica]